MMRTSIGSILLCAWVLWAGGAGQWALVDAYEKKAECDAQRA